LTFILAERGGIHSAFAVLRDAADPTADDGRTLGDECVQISLA
jgi:hypothetical protein